MILFGREACWVSAQEPLGLGGLDRGGMDRGGMDIGGVCMGLYGAFVV